MGGRDISEYGGGGAISVGANTFRGAICGRGRRGWGLGGMIVLMLVQFRFHVWRMEKGVKVKGN